jgi:hypothetical protein
MESKTAPASGQTAAEESEKRERTTARAPQRPRRAPVDPDVPILSRGSSHLRDSKVRLRLRPALPHPSHSPRVRATLSLECWEYTREEYWLFCAWNDAKLARVPWDELCGEILGVTVLLPDHKP